MSIELRNIDGNFADIYEKSTGKWIINYCFAEPPTNKNRNQEMPIKTIIKLKKAGFDAEEIIKLLKEVANE